MSGVEPPKIIAHFGNVTSGGWRDGSLVALPEDLDLILSIHNSSYRESDTLFWPLMALHACGAYTYIWGGGHT